MFEKMDLVRTAVVRVRLRHPSSGAADVSIGAYSKGATGNNERDQKTGKLVAAPAGE